MTAESPSVSRPLANMVDRSRLALWRRQLKAVVALEVARRFHRPRAWLPYLLAFAPAALAVTSVVVGRTVNRSVQLPLAETVSAHSLLFHGFTLPVVVYLGCVGLFSGLFRSELLQGSLHHYLLAPMRREVLLIGKWLAGLAVALPLLCLNAALTVTVMYAGSMTGPAQAATVPLLTARHALGFSITAAAATLGYGTLFLLIGLRAKNPILPAAAVFGWEGINFLLPPVLKQISVVYHVNALSPVPLDSGPFALLGDPSHPVQALTFLVVLAAVGLLLAAVSLRRMELDYGAD